MREASVVVSEKYSERFGGVKSKELPLESTKSLVEYIMGHFRRRKMLMLVIYDHIYNPLYYPFITSL